MLTEIKPITQEEGGFRRLFSDDDMDLFLWYDREDGTLVGFQLCYDKRSAPHAVTWEGGRGCRHNKVDDGEAQVGKHKAAAVLVPDGMLDRARVARAFAVASKGTTLDPATRELVRRVLIDLEVEAGPESRREQPTRRAPDWKAPEPRPAPKPEPAKPPPEERELAKPELARRDPHQWSWLPHVGDAAHVGAAPVVCTKHPSLPGLYVGKVVLVSRWVLFLADAWEGFTAEQAAELGPGAFDRFMNRDRIARLDLKALDTEGSLSIPLEAIEGVEGGGHDSTLTISYREPGSGRRTCRFYSLRWSKHLRQALEEARAEAAPGRRVSPAARRVLDGRYELERVERLERLCVVWRARHLPTGETVALKLVRPELASRAEVIAAVQREARVSAAVSSEHVPTCYDLGTTAGGELYLAAALVEGETLDELAAREGPLEASRAAALVRQLCQAMQAIHDAGVVHGGLRPECVLVARRPGRAERVYVLDLGLAAVVGGAVRPSSGRQTPAEPGVSSATAPEQLAAADDPDHRVDVYAAGAILYELLTGQPPFVARARRALVEEILRADPAPARSLRPGLPEDLGAIVAAAMAADRDDRFRTMEGLAAALAQIG